MRSGWVTVWNNKVNRNCSIFTCKDYWTAFRISQLTDRSLHDPYWIVSTKTSDVFLISASELHSPQSETGSTLTCQEMHYLATGVQRSSPPSHSQLHVIILHSSWLSSSLFQAVFNQFPLSLPPTETASYLCSAIPTFCFSMSLLPWNESIHRGTVNVFWQYFVISSLFILFRV